MIDFQLNSSFEKIEGMTSSHAARLAHVLNNRLTGMQREGSFFESGTYKGKSAAIFASFPNVLNLVLVDASNYLEIDKLEALTGIRPEFFLCKSEDFDYQSNLASHSALIWSHLDASHYFTNVSKEISSIANYMHPDGLICLDDWNDYYPQVRAAYYYLRYKCDLKWELLITGFNKAFLCSQECFKDWSRYILLTFKDGISFDEHSWLVQLARSDYSEGNSRSFHVAKRSQDAPALYGQHIWGDKFYQS